MNTRVFHKRSPSCRDTAGAGAVKGENEVATRIITDSAVQGGIRHVQGV